jgi:hypothetical protein
VNKPRPLPYRQFINRLQTLECCIPVLPTVPNATFMVFRWGATGYAAKPGGPRCTLVHREDDYTVPIKEIEYALHFLDLPEDIFWDISDHTQSKAQTPLELGPSDTSGK